MRKFILWKADKTISFDLNNERALAVDPTGLGNQFATSYKEATDRKYLTNIKPDFEPIAFKIYFNGDGSSGYENYKKLAQFLTKCGKGELLIEYADGITDKFAKVILKSMPKTEVNADGEMFADCQFERQWYWYEDVAESFALKTAASLLSTTFPLSFPFGFAGSVFINKFEISNDFYEDAPIVLSIKGEIKNDIRVAILSEDSGQTVAEVALSRGSGEDTEIIIDADTKKITVTENGETVNGYGLQDPTKQSFLYLPSGKYIITSSVEQDDAGEISIAIKRYLLD